MSWAYWEFAAGFGIFDPAANAWREDLKTALVGDPLPVAAPRSASPRRAGRALRIALDGAGFPASGVAVRGPGGTWTDARGRAASFSQ
jgi:hypothetical protein